MAITSINVGNIANDGTGDDLREAFIKVNDNFNDLENRVTNIPLTAANIGVTGEGIYAQTVDNTLQFKKLIPGQNTVLSSNGNSITIDTNGGMSDFLVLTDNGSINVNGTTYLGIQGGQNIDTRVSTNHLFIDVDTNNLVVQDTSPALGGNLNANNNNITGIDTLSATSMFGNLTGLVHGVDVRTINTYFDNYWDFGPIINRQFNSLIDFIISDYDVDLGSFIGENVSTARIDLGSISS